MDRVPSIDLTTFRPAPSVSLVIEAVRDACEQIGFLVISGVGIEDNAGRGLCSRVPSSISPWPRSASRAANRASRSGYPRDRKPQSGQDNGADVPPDLGGFFFGPIDDHLPALRRPQMRSRAMRPTCCPMRPRFHASHDRAVSRLRAAVGGSVAQLRPGVSLA
jgi:hypothetical protein